MAQYYNLEEAARALGMSTDEFRRKLATEWKTSPRRYPDGATLRFQVREIDELARTLGQGSGEGLKLADSDPSSEFIPVHDESSGPKSGTRGAKPDSDVKLEKSGKVRTGTQSNIRTDEMNLDEAKGQKPATTKKYQSPLEVSGETGGKPPTKKEQSSSEFELSLTPDSSDEFDLKLTEDDSDEVDVGVMPGKTGPLKGDSGINLRSPADSGISLEKSSGDFELQVDSGVNKPKSGPKSGPRSGPKSGPRSGPRSGPKTPSKSAPVPTDDSDSEFELTLDDTPAAAQPDDATAAFAEEQKDIFETDFELPALDDESGSEAVALEESDTDLESSDFDLALGEGDAVAEGGESGSEVVAIPESGRRRRVADDEEVLDEFDEDLAVEEEEAEEPVVVERDRSWGVLPGLVLIPTTVVMVLVGLMSFELVRSMWSYAAPNAPSSPLVRFFAGQFGDLPKD